MKRAELDRRIANGETLEDIVPVLMDDGADITSYDDLKRFAIEKIESDELYLAEHVLKACLDVADYYGYDYSMGTLENPTAIDGVEDLITWRIETAAARGIREGALFLWLFGSRHAGGMKARGVTKTRTRGAAFPPFQQPAGWSRNPPAIESAEKPSTWQKRRTDLPGFPTFRQAPGRSRNPPPIEMLKTPSSRETIGRRRGKVGHAAAAR